MWQLYLMWQCKYCFCCCVIAETSDAKKTPQRNIFTGRGVISVCCLDFVVQSFQTVRYNKSCTVTVEHLKNG